MNDWASSGIKSLDDTIQGLRTGDNVVWQVDDLESYRFYVNAFVERAAQDGRKLVYMRFGAHPPLVTRPGVTTYTLDATSGFEAFSHQVHRIVTEEGPGVFYVFDCLSDLLSAWATDLMIGNFFMVTCPYLYELDTIAYFAVLRNSHSHRTIARIRETTQLLIDIYSRAGRYYVHPIKVYRRYSPTMFLPHLQEADALHPITSSVDASRLFESLTAHLRDAAPRAMDYWDRLFAAAGDLVRHQRPDAEQWAMLEHLTRIMLTTDKTLAGMIRRYFSLGDLLSIRARVVGTGFIGGKAVGMLLARAILLKDTSLPWKDHLEPHDSYYVGSDVFYSYIVQNGWWRLWMAQKTPPGYFKAAATLREKLLGGEFPEEIREAFYQIINYFGQSPIIVRSSSIQEDAYGNAFAGKYESVFLANQGSPEERLARFLDAVRTVYASTMSEDALVYRRTRGLDRNDEQMALLVQRVSGSYHGRYFFPFCAGVGVSYNTFVWNKDMDPRAGMLRLVFGLGTRAVNRVEGDYPRIVALDAPLSQPLAGLADARRFSQHEVDVIDTGENRLRTIALDDLMREVPDIPLDLVGGPDTDAPAGPGGARRWLLNFTALFKETPFIERMQRILAALHGIYRYPVDIEYTLNVLRDGGLQINIVQCRPIQTKAIGSRVTIPERIPAERMLFSSSGAFLGGNIAQNIRRIISIDPGAYAALPQVDRYQVARLIGRLNRMIEDRERLPVLLIGPGRWGTTTPSLGIPVNFFEINNVAVLCEREFTAANLTPELSYGSHFFHDIVETGIFYAALFQEGTAFNPAVLAALPNRFAELLPDEEKYASVISVQDCTEDFMIMSDIVSQKLVCFQPADRAEKESAT